MTTETNKKTNQTLELVVKTLVRAHPFERIVLFGSHATGHSQWDSDLDLLVVWQTDLPPLERALETRRLLEGIDCPLDIVVYTPAELDYWKEAPSSFASQILAEGTTLYERNSAKNSSAAVDPPG
ncbi:MAG: nucleotidyltransferase domain-containing protein [Gemmatimonadetes bacterium]|nr:nucleotidyltransferase domain-containing protein [Gemmatimonadota bacterium]